MSEEVTYQIRVTLIRIKNGYRDTIASHLIRTDYQLTEPEARNRCLDVATAAKQSVR